MQTLYNEIKDMVSRVNLMPPNEKAADIKKYALGIPDEPLSFDKLRQEISVPADTNDFFDQLRRAEDLEELEAVGRKIKASGMTWKEQQRYHNFGKEMAKKFL